MEWLLLGILIVVVLVLGLLALMANAASSAWWAVLSMVRGRRKRAPAMRLPTARCLRCRGTGWLNNAPERTFTFTGEGSADKHTPATMCPDCGGTGVAPVR